MKPEMLDTLLLDRALGELSPEVAALLDEHLEQNSPAAQRAAEFSATLQLARAATVPAASAAPRPLDVAQLHREQRAIRSAMRGRELLRLAGCLALGLGLGWLAHAQRPAPTAAPARAIVLAAPRQPPADPPVRFWSVARYATEAANSAAGKSR